MTNQNNKNSKEPLLVSACLWGKKVRYDGRSCILSSVLLNQLKEHFEIILTCPEKEGGLPCPRLPSEIIENKVINSNGEDLTAQFKIGAAQARRACLSSGAKKALLKEKSPSCGSNFIYDGSFTGKLIPGSGITAGLLKEAGIEVFTENTINELFKKNISS